jgi:multidrug resistance efflux pump
MRRKPDLRVRAVALLALACAVAICAFALSRTAVRTASAHSSSMTQISIPGRVVKWLAKDGDRVEKGQAIAELDVSTQQAELQKAETELTQLENQAQASIQPMSIFPGVSGSLPKQIAEPKFIQIPVKEPAKPEPKIVSKIPQVSPAPKTENPALVAARKSHQSAEDTVNLASDEVKKASAALSEAQKSRDALRPKITQADAAATEAAKKAEGARSLLDQGAISKREYDQDLANRIETQKALEALKGDVADAETNLKAAQTRLQTANESLEKAMSGLEAANNDYTRAAQAPAPPIVAAAKPAPAPVTVKAAPKPQKTETKLVMVRRGMVSEEPPPAIPVKVFVDEETMKPAQQKIAELTKRIADLKLQIAAARLLAPESGILHLSANGAASIEVVATSSLGR